MKYTYQKKVFASTSYGKKIQTAPPLYIIRDETGKIVDRVLKIESARKLGYVPLTKNKEDIT